MHTGTNLVDEPSTGETDKGKQHDMIQVQSRTRQGQGRAGWDRAGWDRAGQGGAGQGIRVQGRAGQSNR